MMRFAACLLVAVVLGCGGDEDPPVGPQTNTCTGTCIVVTNASQRNVDEVNFSACDDSEWGPDRLGTGRLQPGGSRGWSVAAGCWDIRAMAFPNSSEVYAVVQTGATINTGETFTLTYEDPTPP